MHGDFFTLFQVICRAQVHVVNAIWMWLGTAITRRNSCLGPLKPRLIPKNTTMSLVQFCEQMLECPNLEYGQFTSPKMARALVVSDLLSLANPDIANSINSTSTYCICSQRSYQMMLVKIRRAAYKRPICRNRKVIAFILRCSPTSG